MPTFRLYKGGTKVRECQPIWSKTGKIWSPMGPPLPTCFRQVHINALTVTIVCLCDNITLTFHFYKTIVEQNNRFRFTYCRTEAKQSSKVVAVSVCVCMHLLYCLRPIYEPVLATSTYLLCAALPPSPAHQAQSCTCLE